jgi:NAD+ kinase
MTAVSHIGLVVHPTRDISEPLDALNGWAARADVDVVQVPGFGRQREVAEPGGVEDCDVVVAIGGDGTTLAAMRVAVASDRPVIGVACGSLGALTTVAADGVAGALTSFSHGDWNPLPLPALRVNRGDPQGPFALNDIAIVRAGQGQIRTTARVDGVVFARFAGDGCIVSTPVGSSAYALAAGGSLLTPGADAFLLTPLIVHGGFCPPLVLGGGSELQLEVTAGYGGARLEVDGQVEGAHSGVLTVRLRQGVATMATFVDQEPFLTGLRRRQIIIDSPRILADDARE